MLKNLTLYPAKAIHPLIRLKGIFRDSNNIFLWHESKDINKNAYFQNFS